MQMKEETHETVDYSGKPSVAQAIAAVLNIREKKPGIWRERMSW